MPAVLFKRSVGDGDNQISPRVIFGIVFGIVVSGFLVFALCRPDKVIQFFRYLRTCFTSRQSPSPSPVTAMSGGATFPTSRPRKWLERQRRLRADRGVHDGHRSSRDSASPEPRPSTHARSVSSFSGASSGEGERVFPVVAVPSPVHLVHPPRVAAPAS
ncbi:hypothetical protein C8Q79DRAFT_1012927 [Trametes meyenii]|nr:hypothetical protein C8Q79DRAFT_1012927 [Trametes meyenii]